MLYLFKKMLISENYMKVNELLNKILILKYFFLIQLDFKPDFNYISAIWNRQDTRSRKYK